MVPFGDTSTFYEQRAAKKCMLVDGSCFGHLIYEESSIDHILYIYMYTIQYVIINCGKIVVNFMICLKMQLGYGGYLLYLVDKITWM